MACYCQFCIVGDWQACENMEWVEQWQQRALTPTLTHVQHEMTIEDNQVFTSDDYDRVSDLVQEGTLFIELNFVCMHVYMS